MSDICDKIHHLAKRDEHVIMIGESGSGKKFFSKQLHQNSIRSQGPFHIFYCVGINEDEYTDAFREQLQFDEEHIILKYNAIEKASFGILYLDQFSDLTDIFKFNIINSFIKGCNQIFRYDHSARPRLIISIKQEEYQQLLQTDIWDFLLDQLDPICLMLPPLREHKEDIPALIGTFLGELRTESKEFKDLNISSDVIEKFLHYNWPGNIRQLKNVLKQGAILSHGKTIELHHLPYSMSWRMPYKFEKYP